MYSFARPDPHRASAPQITRAEQIAPESVIVAVPVVNEEAHVAACLRSLLGECEAMRRVRIVVADGGSHDRTREIVENLAAGAGNIQLIDNPGRLQSSGVNRVVEQCAGPEHAYLVRCDAHAVYRAGYPLAVASSLAARDSEALVVPMDAKGAGCFQRAAAWVADTRLGSGGSLHRGGRVSGYVDHGHHAGFRLHWFRKLGGYDESFSHNEDAELDYRLRAAGYRIWMTDKTFMVYYPRASVPALFRQYLGYGRGRARNILKHRAMPKIRQMIPLMVLPVVAGASLAVLNLTALIPAGLWVAVCLGYGVWLAVDQRNPYGPLAGFSAMVMHLAWSTGFWLQILDPRTREASAS